MIRIILTLAITFCAFGLNATTYYIDTNGEDTNDGSEENPFRNPQSAFNILAPGDSVLIKEGDYRAFGQLQISVFANQSNPIVIAGIGSSLPIVQGFTVFQSSHILFDKLRIVGPESLPNGWVDMPTRIVDDPNIIIVPDETFYEPDFRVDKILSKYSTYATFFNYNRNTNSTWESNSSKGFNIINSTHLTIRNCQISLQTYGFRLKQESEFITIEDNEIIYCLDGISGFADGLDYEYSFSNSTIRNNTIRQSFRNGIMLNYGANNNLVDGNDIRYTGQNHIGTFNQDIRSPWAGHNTISHNRVAFGGYYSEFMKFPGPSGISLHSSGPGCLVNANFIAYHVSYSQLGENLIDGNGLISDNNPDGTIFVNNITYRNRGNDLSIVKAQNNIIIHNTFLYSGHNDDSPANGMGIKIVEEDDINNVIANNIFFNSGRGGIFSRDSNLEQQLFIDHNVYHFNEQKPVAANSSQTFNSIPFLDFENNGLLEDPLVQDSVGRLSENSPAIGSANSQYSFPTDFLGEERDPSNPSIGAFEYANIVGLNPETPRSILIYPNPVETILHVSALSTELSDISIMTLSGKVTRSWTSSYDQASSLLTLDVSGLSSGVYVLRIGTRFSVLIKE